MRKSHRFIVSWLGALAIASLAHAAQESAPPAPARPDAPPQVNPPGENAPAPAPRRPRERGQRASVPDEIELVRDVVYATAPTDDGDTVELKLDAAFLKQSDGKPMPVIVYIHGGGWAGGSKDDAVRQSVALALGGYFAVAIDYRLSGQATYPAAVHDCKAAIRFLKANAEQLGIDPGRIGVWGHSAGGHLASLLGTSGNTSALDGQVGTTAPNIDTKVHCVVDICGPIDLTRDGVDGMIAQWLGGPPHKHPELARQASPVTHVDANDPPVLIIHGTADELVNIRHAELFHKALKEAGVEVEYMAVEGAGHAIREPRAYARAAAFFDEHLGGRAAGAIGRAFQQNAGGRRRAAERPDATPPATMPRD